MAKKATTSKTSETKNSSDLRSDDKRNDAEVAAFVVRCVTGCGVPESHATVSAMEESIVAKMAAAERSGNRKSAARLITRKPRQK